MSSSLPCIVTAFCFKFCYFKDLMSHSLPLLWLWCLSHFHLLPLSRLQALWGFTLLGSIPLLSCILNELKFGLGFLSLSRNLAAPLQMKADFVSKNWLSVPAFCNPLDSIPLYINGAVRQILHCTRHCRILKQFRLWWFAGQPCSWVTGC